MGNLVQLNTLSFSDNQLKGTIPSTLDNLVQLMELGLSKNQLIGTIPATLLLSMHMLLEQQWDNLSYYLKLYLI